jgi:plasmid stability protein
VSPHRQQECAPLPGPPGLAKAMRRAAVALAFLLAFAGRAAADYYDGLQAYENENYVVAAHAWLLAGSQGDAQAQYRLGQLYEHGLGMPENLVQAHRWYNIAASHGHAEAREARDALARRLTTDQLAQAQRLATQNDMLPKPTLKRRAMLGGAHPRAQSRLRRFDGRWTAGAELHFSSPRNKCGYQVIKLGVLDGQVKGKLHIGSTHFRDAAAGDYLFYGSIDRNGRFEAKGRGVSVSGVISREDFTFSGKWDAFGVGCKGTYEGSKEF